MSFDFTIRIVGKGPAQFIPQGGKAGDPLNVVVNDIVSWGNDTDKTHQPWPTDSQGKLLPGLPMPFLSNPIAPHDSSKGWIVGGVGSGTLNYRCATHPNDNEFGKIIIT